MQPAAMLPQKRHKPGHLRLQKPDKMFTEINNYKFVTMLGVM